MLEVTKLTRSFSSADAPLIAVNDVSADPRTGMTLAIHRGTGKDVFFSAAGTSAAGPL